MATVKPFAIVCVLAAACGDIKGVGGPEVPLVSFQVEVTGDFDAVRVDADPPHLQVALVWGRQWLVEALCILPAENADAQAVIDAGCRNPFGFVPARVAGRVSVEPGVPAQLDLFSLPAADVMVGDVTARVAYGSLIVYDDRNGNDTLDLARPRRVPDMGDGGGSGDVPIDTIDIVYGASFVAMTEPDVRVAFREGAFLRTAAFYPRAGCGDPPPAFSVLAAGGFTAEAAIAATLAGMLPQEDPATCKEQGPADAVIAVPLRSPTERDVAELKCTERRTDSSVRYREPDPLDPPDFTGRTLACVHTPSFGMPSETIELVVSGRPEDSCVGLTHYVLKGCREGPQCDVPDWDHSLAPPDWWPCK